MLHWTSWLVARKRYLIDGMGVAAWLFWESFYARWKILFLRGGGHMRWMQDEIATQGENGHTRWLFHCGGDNSTWGYVRWVWGYFSHTWWECPHEVRFANERKVNGHVRYEPPSEILHSLIFFNGRAKRKLAMLVFLHCGEIVKSSIDINAKW